MAELQNKPGPGTVEALLCEMLNRSIGHVVAVESDSRAVPRMSEVHPLR